MKKFLLSLAVALLTVGAQAKEDIDLSNLVTDGIADFTDAWQWKTINTYGGGNSTEGYTYGDKSTFDYLICEYSSSEITAKMIIQYDWKGTTGQYGDEFNEDNASISANPNGGMAAIKLSDKKNTIFSIALQNAGDKGKIAITSIYWATEEEYRAAKEKASQIEDISILDADGGEHKLAAEDWGWDSKWLATDVSKYNSLVFEIASVTGKGKIEIQAADGEAKIPEITLPESSEPTVYAADISEIKTLNQYAFQNINTESGNKEDIKETIIVVTKVYLTSKKVEDFVSVKAIASESADAVAYDLFGNAGATEGLMVKGGKKVYVK